MMLKYRPTIIEISLSQLASNFQTIKKQAAPNAFICPMIKSNAYGHGSIEIAKQLVISGASALGVGQVEEALELKSSNINAEILVFSFWSIAAAKSIVENKFTAVVSNWNQLNDLCEIKKEVKVHIKFNTGMNRLGFEIEESLQIKDTLEKNKFLNFQGIISHLVDAKNEVLYKTQVDKFTNLKKVFSNATTQFHLLNSEGAFQSGGSEPWGLRPGIALYGLGVEGLKPVLSLKTQVAQLRAVKKGDTVSYGAEWKAERDSLIGVIPIGYADGLLRGYHRQGQVLVSGQRVGFAGRICMDFSMIDLTEVSKHKVVKVGDEVIIIGKQQSEEIKASEMAQKLNTIDYEIVTSLNLRIPRIYSN